MEQAIFLTEKQMDKQMNSLTMTAREIFDVTGYKQPARQKRVFETLGVPVHIRPDGTVSVCRQHYLESYSYPSSENAFTAATTCEEDCMNRPRKNGKHLPRRMIESHGSYFLLKPSGFRRNKAIRLGRGRGVEGKTEDELYAQALKRYADLIAEVDAPVGTMVKLLERWKNEALSKYALKTRKEYIRMTDIASKAFAEFDIEHVRPMHIAAFVDDNFIDKPNAANKYKALLSLVFSFAVRKGLRDDNPCRDIHGVPEPKRQRYITDEELARVRAAAL